jgi:type II secretory pathway pseudopilin PulG
VTRSSCRHPAAGYSLVELLVSALLFAIIGTGSVTLFSLTVRQQTRTEGLQAEQFAISIDEANLQRMNDRFTCQSGTCVIKTGTAPNQNEYYPLVGSAAEATFLALCSPTSSGAPALADPLVALINAVPPISRQAVREAETVAQPFAHRYTITWRSRDDTILRQNTLVPTTAGWCP